MTKSACPDAPRGLSRAAGCSAPCHCFTKSLITPCRPSAIGLPRPALLGLATAPATRRCALSPNPDPRPSAQPQTTHRCSSPHATASGVVIPPHTTPQARRSTFSLRNVLNALPARRLDLAASRPPPPHRSSGFARRARPPARPSPAQRTQGYPARLCRVPAPDWQPIARPGLAFARAGTPRHGRGALKALAGPSHHVGLRPRKSRTRGNGHIRCQTRERRVGGRRDDLLRTSRTCIKGRSATAVSTANAG